MADAKIPESLGKCEIQKRHDDGDLTIACESGRYVVTTEGELFRESCCLTPAVKAYLGALIEIEKVRLFTLAKEASRSNAPHAHEAVVATEVTMTQMNRASKQIESFPECKE